MYAVEFSHDGERTSLNGDVSFSRFEETYADTKDINTSSSTARGDIDDSEQDARSATLRGSRRF